MGTKEQSLRLIKIGQLLEEARYDVNVGQIELAELLGISQSTISKIEGGGRSKHLNKLMDYYIQNHGYSKQDFEVHLDQVDQMKQDLEQLKEEWSQTRDEWKEVKQSLNRVWSIINKGDPD